jgi:hypothetical protein
MVVGGEIPELVYECVSNALVKGGYFPSDPTQPFFLIVLCTATSIDEVNIAVAALQLKCEALQIPVVCCTNRSRTYIMLTRDVSWERVQGGPEFRSSVIACSV